MFRCGSLSLDFFSLILALELFKWKICLNRTAKNCWLCREEQNQGPPSPALSPLCIAILYIRCTARCILKLATDLFWFSGFSMYSICSVLSQYHNLKGSTNLSAVKKIARCTKLHLSVKNCFDLSLNISITKNIGSICAIFRPWGMIFQKNWFRIKI